MKYGDISLVLCISTRLQLVTILSLLVKYLVIFHADLCNKSDWRASEASETLSGLFNRESRIYILLTSERSERDTLRSVQLRIADIYIYINTMAECRSGRKCIAVK